MNKTLVVIAVLVVVAGAAYWLVSHKTVEAPANTEPVADEQSDGEETYVGLSVTEAQALAAENNVPFRVVERDGELLPTTKDFRLGRVNAIVESNLVVDYSVEGDETMPGAAGASSKPTAESEASEGDKGGPAKEHDAIIGMTEAEAMTYAETNEVSFRVGFRDGEALSVMMDYQPGRITAAIEDGVVTEYTVE